MPIHDWTRVDAGIFHHFHQRWLAAIADTLNDGRMPESYYALAEQKSGPFGPDVLALQSRPSSERNGTAAHPEAGGIAVLEAPPKTRFKQREAAPPPEPTESAVAIRHISDDRIVAIFELISPGNKAGDEAFRSLVGKIKELLLQGIHLTYVDLFPPTPRDPQGVHGAVWRSLFGKPFAPPPDKPLSAAAYESGPEVTAYLEPLAVGDRLPELPVFLGPGRYVPVPLEQTYQEAYLRYPKKWKDRLEGKA